MMTEPSPVVDSLAYVIRIEADVLTWERLVVYVTPKLRNRDQLYCQLQFSIQIWFLWELLYCSCSRTERIFEENWNFSTTT